MNSSVTNIIKTAAVVLCAVVLIVAPAGDAFTGGSHVFTGPGVDINAAMNTFPPDKAIISSGNHAITWDMFYYFLHGTAAQVTDGFREEIDWSEPSPAGGTLFGLVLGYAIEQSVQALVYEYGIYVMGVSLSEEEEENIQSYIDSILAEADSLEALDNDLRSDGFFGLAGFEKMMRSFTLQAKLPISLYGESYSDVSDDVIIRYAEDGGYMRAKHILKMFPSEQDGLSAQESEAAKETAYSEAAALLEMLNSRKNDGDFVDFFTSVMLSSSDDPGSLNLPDGYLFQYGDMVPEFSDTCRSLGLGEMSGIVETAYGYHIILRLPLDYDNMVPVSLSGTGQAYTLRQLAILDDFDKKYYQWLDSMSPEFAPELDTLDLAVLFAWHQ